MSTKKSATKRAAPARKLAQKQGNKITFIKYGSKAGNPKPPESLVDGLIYEKTTVALIGPPASMKSFVARDICCSVVAGRRCFGRKVKKGMAVMLIGEGNEHMEHRIRGYESEHKVKVSGKGRHLFYTASVPSLMDPQQVEGLAKRIARHARGHDVKPMIVCIDPLARFMVGSDENNALDMGMLLENVDRWFRRYLKCTVLFVHHSGHGQGRARGSSAFGAAMDTMIEVKKTTKNGVVNVMLTCTKQKDAADFEPICLVAKTIDVPSADSEGREGTSVALHSGSHAALTKEDRLLELLRKLLKQDKATEITAVRWRDAAILEGLMSKKKFEKYKGKLRDAGRIVVEGKVVRLPKGA